MDEIGSEGVHFWATEKLDKLKAFNARRERNDLGKITKERKWYNLKLKVYFFVLYFGIYTLLVAWKMSYKRYIGFISH